MVALLHSQNRIVQNLRMIGGIVAAALLLGFRLLKISHHAIPGLNLSLLQLVSVPVPYQKVTIACVLEALMYEPRLGVLIF